MITNYLGDGTRRAVDGASALVAVGTITNLLPHLAALFTVIWTLIQIWETKTVQRIRRRRRFACQQRLAERGR